MVTSPLLPVIDYTSRDYEAIRNDMIRLIRARIPQWTADNPSDFGVALVEAFAYGVDTLHYYLDRIANEAYLSTAVQRESLFSIADMFNYIPRGASAATVDLVFSNTTPNEVTVPAKTRVQASISGSAGTVLKNFETDTAVVIAPATPTTVGKSLPVSATEGRTYTDETLGVSNGFVRQQFLLPRTSVLPGTVEITTQLGSSTVEWVEVEDLEQARPEERVFQIRRLTDGSSMVMFGDGLRGDIPGLHAVIRATYRVGGGTGGNVPAATVTTIVEPVLYGVTVTNEAAATGGKNAESLNSIRINAARAFRSRDRAVTQADFVALAESVTGVQRAKAVGNNGSSVTVYVLPNDDGTGQPGLSASLDTTVTSLLEDQSMAGVTVQVFGSAYQQIHLAMNLYVKDTALPVTVEAAARAAIADLFAFENVDFDQKVTSQKIYDALSGVDGLDYAEITGLGISPFPNTVTTVVMSDIAVNACLYYDDATSLPPASLNVFGGVGG